MANEFPDTASANPEGSSPSVKQAAEDLRAAAGEKAREIAQSTTGQAKVLKERAVEKARQISRAASEKAEEWKSVAGEKAQHFRESASERWYETRDKAHDIHVSAEDYIREHPTKCVLGALGIGFVIGLIVRR